MQLVIKRNQADVKGLFGGHKGVRFNLSAMVKITDEEKALIERYKVGDYVLASYERPLKGEAFEVKLTVHDFINGRSVEMDSISTLLDLEEQIKLGCQNLKNLLLVMRTFGGEQVVEI